MNITSHKSVLSALEARANRFSDRNKLSTLDDKLLSSALDETGTVDITCDNLNVSNNESERLALIQQEIKNIREISITDERQKSMAFSLPKKETVLSALFTKMSTVLTIALVIMIK